MDGVRRWADMLAALRLAQRKARCDRWSAERLRAWQGWRLGALVRHTARATWLHADLYFGLDLGDPVDLAALPTTSKGLLMDRFDDALADPRLTRAAVMAHAAGLRGDALPHGHHRVIATTGTSRHRGHFVHDRPAWRAVLAEAFRKGRASPSAIDLRLVDRLPCRYDRTGKIRLVGGAPPHPADASARE